MADQSVRPPYGSVEAHVERLRPYAPHDANIYACAFGIVEGLVTTLRLDTPAEQLRYVRNVVTAVNQVRGEGADDPTPVSGGRVEPHVGAMTDDGLVEVESEPPVQHSLAGGSFGGPGKNSAQCACGDTYGGFATPAEANLRLAMHIDSANSPES